MANFSLAAVLPALIALVGALVVAALGYFQWRKAQAATKQLEAQKLEHQQKQLEWEREKFRLTRQAEDERAREEAKAERARARQEAERAERDKRRSARRQSFTDIELASGYRSALISQLRSLKILDMSRPLDLEKLFVQVSIREELSQFAQEREIRELAEGDPREHVVRPERQTVVTVRPKEALHRYRRIVVLGDPGSGKTTMSRHLALCGAQDALATPTSLPVYVELRHFVDSGVEDLVAYIVAVLGENYGFEDCGPYVDTRFADGDAVLLLDGLDEVLGGSSEQAATDTYDRIVGEINRVAVRYPNLPIAVTCRRAGWRPGLASFTTLEVVDFTWKQICEFIDNWFDTSPARGRQLKQALTGNLRMQALATNPLVLSLIAIVFERELELPERRAELYNRCAEVLLREWDAHRSIRRFSKFTTDRKRDLLQAIAWHFHRRGRRYFPESELLDVIAEFLPTIGIEAGESDAILKEIAAQYGLLKEQAHGWYGFLHLTVQEYFAAVAAAPVPERVDHVVRHRHDSWWEEVLLLLAGLVPDATGLLTGVLGLAPRQKISARRDDVFCSDLLLAARCLVGTPRISDTTLRAEILREVKAELLKAKWTFVRDRAAAALIQVGTEEATTIVLQTIADLSLDESVRVSAARALRELPDRRKEREFSRLLSEGPRTHGIFVIRTVLNGIVSTNSNVGTHRLVAMLDDEEFRHLKPNVYSAIGSSGDTTTIPILVDRLNAEQSRNRGRFTEFFTLINAITELNGREAIPTLKRLLLLDIDEPIQDTLADAIAKLGRQEEVKYLVDLLKEKDNTPAVRMAAGQALSHANADYLIDPALDCLTEPKVDWTAKWQLVLALDRAAVDRDIIEQLYHNPTMDTRTKVALATSMAAHGNASVLPVLHDAIKNQVVPPGLRIDMNDMDSLPVGHCWTWICKTLHSWKDETVNNTLLEMITETLPKYDDHSDHRRALTGMIQAAGELEIESLFHLVYQHFFKNMHSRFDWDIQRILSSVVTASTAPVLAKEISKKRGEFDSWTTTNLISKIGQVASDRETIKMLWRAISKHEFYYVNDDMLEAIHTICRRGRFRLYPNGSVKGPAE